MVPKQLLSLIAGSFLFTTVWAQEVTTHVIQVGDMAGTALKFFPEKVTAKKGDLIQFQFYPKSHSVAHSNFESPCQPIEKSNSSASGFWSGMMPVDLAGNKTIPVFTIPVMDEKPIWFYCATGKHCQGGMVGVVNEPVDKKLETYKEKAKAVAAAGIPRGSSSGGADSKPSTTGSGSTNSIGTLTSIPTSMTSEKASGASTSSISFTAMLMIMVLELFLAP